MRRWQCSRGQSLVEYEKVSRGVLDMRVCYRGDRRKESELKGNNLYQPEEVLRNDD